MDNWPAIDRFARDLLERGEQFGRELQAKLKAACRLVKTEREELASEQASTTTTKKEAPARKTRSKPNKTAKADRGPNVATARRALRSRRKRALLHQGNWGPFKRNQGSCAIKISSRSAATWD
jgi:hypothetical protein